jgi:hypothetical protein
MKKILLVALFLLAVAGFFFAFYKFIVYIVGFHKNTNIARTKGYGDDQLLVAQKEAHQLFSELLIKQGISSNFSQEFVTYKLNTLAVRSQIKWHKETPWFGMTRSGSIDSGRSFKPSIFTHFTFSSATERHGVWVVTNDATFSNYARQSLGLNSQKKIKIPNSEFHDFLVIQTNEDFFKFEDPNVLSQIFELSRSLNAVRIFISQHGTEVTLSLGTSITTDHSKDTLFNVMGKVMGKKIRSSNEILQKVNECISTLSH